MKDHNINDNEATKIIDNLFSENIELDSWLFNYKKPNKVSKIHPISYALRNYQ